MDKGHRREIDLAVEIPRSPLDAVMSHEVWEEYYDRLTQLIGEHTDHADLREHAKDGGAHRAASERAARRRRGRRASREPVEGDSRSTPSIRLKNGTLKALVATASLELGIDIGHVDLVCQVGSPHRIATLLQRVGRSGHTISGTPKGRLLPVSRDDLVECAALLRVRAPGRARSHCLARRAA